MYSFNSWCEKDFNIFSNLKSLFLTGFNAAYLFFFNWTMYALLVLSFVLVYILLLPSSNIINVLNSVCEWNHIYFHMVLVFIFFLGEKKCLSNVMKLI